MCYGSECYPLVTGDDPPRHMDLGCSGSSHPNRPGYGGAASRAALAPGQIVTFYLTDFAHGVSLPIYRTDQASAAGIEASMVSTFTGIADLPVDNILVESAQYVCVSCGTITAVTLQVPMNMEPNFPGFPRGRNEAVLLISDRISYGGAVEDCRSLGATCTSMNAQLVPDEVHILQSCDVYAVGMGSAGTDSTNGPVPLHDVIVAYSFA